MGPAFAARGVDTTTTPERAPGIGARFVRTLRLGRLGRALRVVADKVPLTLTGLVLLVASGTVAIVVGRGEADHLLYTAGLLGVGLVGLSALFVTLAALVVRARLRRADPGIPTTLETTIPTRTAFKVPALAAWPFVEVTCTWTEPADFTVKLVPERRTLEEIVTAHARGRHGRVVRKVTVADIFGFAAISFRVTWREPFRVVPVSAAATAELVSSIGPGDAFSHPAGRAEGDLVEMRRYGPGDPFRMILWKAFARTRRLLVRVPERAVAPQPITVGYLVAGPSDEASSGVARLYLERGVLGPDFLFAADGTSRLTRKTEEAIEQIVDSGAARRDGGAALAGFAQTLETMRLGTCVVFAPPRDGPWRQRVAAFSRALPAPATVVIGVEGLTEPPPTGRLVRVLFQPRAADDALGAPTVGAAPPRPEDLIDPHALAALRAALEADGMRVQVLHRKTGQLL